jgi:Tfp pilus assembly protein PilF
VGPGVEQRRLDLAARRELLLRAERLRLAQYFFQEALKRDPSNVEALVGKGRALGCQGAFGSAVESFREAIATDAGTSRPTSSWRSRTRTST